MLGNREHEAAHLYEILETQDDVEVLGKWSNRFASGRAMITSRKFGKGHAVYMGTYLTASLVEDLADQLFVRAGITPLVADLPPSVEVTVREADDRKLMFVLNTDEAPVNVSSLPSGVDLLSGSAVQSSITLGPYGCAVIRH